jgi:hypothetical protein
MNGYRSVEVVWCPVRANVEWRWAVDDFKNGQENGNSKHVSDRKESEHVATMHGGRRHIRLVGSRCRRVHLFLIFVEGRAMTHSTLALAFPHSRKLLNKS